MPAVAREAAAGGGPVGESELLGKGVHAFCHGEGELAVATGIAQKMLARARRQLRQGLDWDLRAGLVAYSARGLVAVLEKVTGKPAVDGVIAGVRIAELEKRVGTLGFQEDKPINGMVTRLYPNRHLLQVHLQDGTTVNVRVKDSKNFRRGMVLPLARSGGAYELARRLPRFPGRW